MDFSGLTIANGKKAFVMFNPGWGEPGEWYVSLDDGVSLCIDNAEGMGGNQVEFLSNISSDEYREIYFKNNWSTVGTFDDVVRFVLEYVGYNDDNEAEDKEHLDKALATIKAFSEAVTRSLEPAYFNLAKSLEATRKFKQKLEDASAPIEAAQDRIRVYNELKQGNPVGRNWSNESFLRQFPNDRFAPLAEKYLKKDNAND
jgi:hypothetical protein